MEKTLLLILSLAVGCSKSVDNKSALQKAVVGQQITETREINQEDSSVEITQGLVSLGPNYKMGSVLAIYNQDGSLWKSFSFKEDGMTDIKGLAPFSLHPDYFLLVFRCLETREGRYKVIANEETGEVKYIKANDPNFKFEKWEAHLLGLFAVGFNPKRNPIREKATETSKTVAYNQDEFYHPSKVQGNWLQIKWGTEGNWQYGWIEWKKKDRLIIELFYFA